MMEKKMKKHKVIFRILLIVICCMCFTVTGYARAGGGGSSGGSGGGSGSSSGSGSHSHYHGQGGRRGAVVRLRRAIRNPLALLPHVGLSPNKL